MIYPLPFCSLLQSTHIAMGRAISVGLLLLSCAHEQGVGGAFILYLNALASIGESACQGYLAQIISPLE